MRYLLIFLLISLALDVTFARNLIKRSCDDYRECSSPCSTPCNRPRNCNNNNNFPCNNNREVDDSSSVPVLIPFPPAPNVTYPRPPGPTINNTNINNSTMEISIQNTIDNVNNISVPISLNSTNENTITIHFQRLPAGNPDQDNQPTVAPASVDCCLVVTPGRCDAYGKNCGEERNWVCSEVCKGSKIVEPEREVPAQLTVKNENSTTVSTLSSEPLCRLANGTTVPCSSQAPVYSLPYQVIYQPAPQPIQQPIYSVPWLPIQRNYTTRPIQQIIQVPNQPFYTQQVVPVYSEPSRQPIFTPQVPIYNPPSRQVVSTQPVYVQQPSVQYIQRPVLQPQVQTFQQVPVVVPQATPQLIPRINQREYIGAYQENVRASFPFVNQPSQWVYQRQYQAPRDRNYVVSTYEAPCPYSQQGPSPSRSPCGASVVPY